MYLFSFVFLFENAAQCADTDRKYSILFFGCLHFNTRIFAPQAPPGGMKIAKNFLPDVFASGGNPDTGLTVIISGSRINADIGDDLVVYPDISLIARAADKLVVIDLDTVVFPEVGLELSLPRIARGRGGERRPDGIREIPVRFRCMSSG